MPSAFPLMSKYTNLSFGFYDVDVGDDDSDDSDVGDDDSNDDDNDNDDDSDDDNDDDSDDDDSDNDSDDDNDDDKTFLKPLEEGKSADDTRDNPSSPTIANGTKHINGNLFNNCVWDDDMTID